jgi:FMN phosphatase YigB (HAD superfamily)
MKTIIVDCYGTVFDNSYFEGKEITEADQYRLKYENPVRSMENQKSSVDYLSTIDNMLQTSEHDTLYTIGTNGEVLSARHIMNVDANSFSAPVGYINTISKFEFAKDFLSQSEVTIITDQYYSQVYRLLNVKHNIDINIEVVERQPVDAEIPNIDLVLSKHKLI